MAGPVVEKRGMELVAVEYVKEGGSWYLRLYIDKEGGVDLEDCQAVSGEVSELLDRTDPIPHSYFLEVSSPGIERILQTEKDFRRFRGRKVNVTTFAPVEGKKKLRGNLGEVDGDGLQLLLDGGKELKIPGKIIAQVRLAWEEEGGRVK
ncbi:MAG: ribosome maturation factor RimP [Peptococcaceae bacterium]|nr:ribosome maturation factor RimP [Peptococcaceae bacterium]MDH7524081.1 ribosome maturation factor RimP [Peptococcaceae bacterium]